MTQELIERLRHSVVIRKGETIVLDMGDGPKPVSSGDVVQLRNPDGPEAANALQSQSAHIAELEGVLEQVRDWRVNGAPDKWVATREEMRILARLALTKDSTSGR